MIEAVVQTGSFETAYRRAGCGGAVLLLVGESGPSGDWLFDQIAARFRTIAPVPPAGVVGGPAQDSFQPWLRGLIDGLGLQRPAVVAGAADGAALVRFAAVDPHRVERLALVRHGAAAVPEDPALEAAAAPQPVLVVAIPGADEPEARAAALGRLLEFLAAPAPQAMTGSRSVS